MATQVSARNACFLDGIAVAAQDLRDGVNAPLTATAAAGSTGIARTAGVFPGQGNPLGCVWTSGMSFNLNAGMCMVQGTASATAGLWPLVLDTTTLLTCTASDPTNPRIDSVIAVVVDNGNNTSTTVFKILPGTPAGSPVAPTLPANALLLCNIAVAANAVALSAGVFTDKRVWTSASGGILLVANAALGTTVNGATGSYVDDLTTGRLRRLDSSGNARQPKTAAFTPVSASFSSTSVPNSSTTLASVSVTTDGVTEVEIICKWSGASESPNGVAGDTIALFAKIDGVTVDSWTITQGAETANGTVDAGTYIIYNTPSAATHTVTFTATGGSTGGNAFTMLGGAIRVAPAFN